jgi:hypothetical protein
MEHQRRVPLRELFWDYRTNLDAYPAFHFGRVRLELRAVHHSPFHGGGVRESVAPLVAELEALRAENAQLHAEACA